MIATIFHCDSASVVRINIHLDRPTIVLDEVYFVRFMIFLVYFLDASVLLLRVVHCLSDQIDLPLPMSVWLGASGIERRLAMLDCIY